MRGVIGVCAGAFVLVASVAGCGAHPANSDAVRVRPAADTPGPTPARTSAPAKSGENGAAVPACGGPEVQPDWWTPNCGDAGYQLEPRWDSWSALSATAHGTVTVTHGPDAGKRWSVHVVFDRPRAVAAYANRPLFSRLVVRYDDGHGPDGHPTETMDLAHVWQDAIQIAG